MQQFDICRVGDAKRGRKRSELVLIVQHDIARDLATRLVAPLYMEGELPAIGHLRPTLTCGGKTYLAAIDRIGSVPQKTIGDTVGSAVAFERQIKRALDEVFFGV